MKYNYLGVFYNKSNSLNMDEFMNITVLWFIVGFIFFLLEFIVPGFILFFFGIAAWIVAILTLFTDIGLNTQLIIFLITAIVSVILLRKVLKDKLGMYREGPRMLEDEYIGKIALAETAITPQDNGKVEFKGASWDAKSDDYIVPGQKVQIIETRSILLIVKQI
ncbi:MAG: NfeD family protein [Flavobacterium sp.]|nr:MAG: NfeD family protein [Flavobacterium sp.]